MAWPSDQDYNEAIQNPRLAFADQELQSGQVELNAMGIPKARSGNFATVYKVTTPGSAHAVRCFRYDNPEHNSRYPVIAAYLSQNALPYMVSFRYMSKGIRVGPSWYPFVSMRWLEGDSLISYIEKHLSAPTRLRDLASDWAKMLADLRQAKVAHGDLQHGNVLVVQGKLRLVDYDGMYVPALEGSRGIELGHRNYQHPQRTELDFGDYLDNFSAWLIYASLVALASQPKLWGQLRGGDECLLFRKADFDAPEQSTAFRLLRAVPDAQVRALTNRIEYFLWLPPDQVPAISDQDLAAKIADSLSPTSTSFPNWIQDYVSQFADETADGFPAIETGDPSWLQDHVEQTTEIYSFSNNVQTDRCLALFAVFSAFAVCTWFSFFVGPLLVFAVWIGGIASASLITGAVWRLRYGTEPVYAAMMTLRSELTVVNGEKVNADRVLAEIKETRLRRRSKFNEDASLLQARESGLRADEQKKLAEIDASLQAALQQITSRMRSMAADEGAEKRKLAESLGNEISRLLRALSALSDQQRQELSRIDLDIGSRVASLASQLQQATTRRDGELRTSLKDYQDQIVNGYLQKFRLSDANVPGIGPQLTQRLAGAGLVSAADIGVHYANVAGIGQKKWAALDAWRQQLEGPFRAREVPNALPPHESAAIELHHESRIKQLQQNLHQEQALLFSAQQKVRTQILDQKRLFEQQKTNAENSLRQQTAVIEKRFGDHRTRIVADEGSARLQHRQATEMCRSQFRNAAAQLAHESDEVKKDYRMSLDQFNKQIEAAARYVREISWKRSQTQQRIHAHASRGFRHYVLRVLGQA